MPWYLWSSFYDVKIDQICSFLNISLLSFHERFQYLFEWWWYCEEAHCFVSGCIVFEGNALKYFIFHQSSRESRIYIRQVEYIIDICDISVILHIMLCYIVSGIMISSSWRFRFRGCFHKGTCVFYKVNICCYRNIYLEVADEMFFFMYVVIYLEIKHL